jgi:exopolysaccharide production protein ExoZ
VALPASRLTLCFEVLFYAAFTVVLLERRLIFVVCVIFALALTRDTRQPIFQFLGSPLIFEFIFGITLAYLPRVRWAAWLIPHGVAAIVMTSLLGVLPNDGRMDLFAPIVFKRVLVIGIPAAMIVFGAMQIEAKSSTWTVLGDASYSLYLTHMLPIFVLHIWWSRHPITPDLMILVVASIAVLVAWRIYVLFEVPTLKWLGRRTNAHLPPTPNDFVPVA